MALFITILGLLQIIGGALTFLAAKSAIHEILGAVAFGMGILSIALAVIIVQLDEIKKASEETARIAFGSMDAQLKIAEAFDRIAQ